MATNYLLTDMPPELHADLKTIADRQRRTIKQVMLIAFDREVQRVLKSERASKHCPIV